MATYLQLVQRVGSDSGTISGNLPATLVGVTDIRLLKIKRWVNEAWRSIQNAHATWLWLQAEFSGPTVAGTQRYAYNAAGFVDVSTSAAITRFADWIYSRDDTDSGFSLYDSTGVATEGPLTFRDWNWFYASLRGTQTSGKPSAFTITPENKIGLYYKPDAVYTIRGRYRKDVQDLTVDADVPECPVRFHDVIVDLALIMLGTHDESPTQIPLWQMRRVGSFRNLERDQLPPVTLAGPLA